MKSGGLLVFLLTWQVQKYGLVRLLVAVLSALREAMFFLYEVQRLTGLTIL
jgi:hypothetical protein